MSSAQINELAMRLLSDERFRRDFKVSARAAVERAGIPLSPAELEALGAVDWSEMTDEELLVRVEGAYTRATTATV